MSFAPVLGNVASTALILTALALIVLVQTTAILGLGIAVARFLRGRGAVVESACQRIVLCAALFAPLASALIGLGVARVRIPFPAFEEAAPQALADDARQAPRAASTLQTSD